MTKVLLKTPGRAPQVVDVTSYEDRDFPDLGGVRQAMFTWQAHTESTEIMAEVAETGEPLAKLIFEWVDD